MKPDIPKKAPGQKLIKKMPLSTKWLLCAFAATILYSVSLFALLNAAVIRSKELLNPSVAWILWAVYGGILFLGATFLFGQAVRFKTTLDFNSRINRLEREIVKRIKKSPKQRSRSKDKPD